MPITLEDIFDSLKEQKAEIKEAKDDNIQRIEKFMTVIEMNIAEVRRDVSVLNNIMEERERENQDLHRRTNEKIEESERRRREDREEMYERMRRLELGMRGEENQEKGRQDQWHSGGRRR